MNTKNQTVAGTEPAPLTEAQTRLVSSMQDTLDSMYARGNPQEFAAAPGSILMGEPILQHPATPMKMPAVRAPGVADDTPLEKRGRGNLLRAAAENVILSRHSDEIDSLAKENLAQHQAVQKFKFLAKAISEWEFTRGGFKKEIESLLTTDLAKTIFENVAWGKTITQITSHPDFQAAFAIRQPAVPGGKTCIGEILIKKIDDEFTALKREFDHHVTLHTALLQERGLI